MTSCSSPCSARGPHCPSNGVAGARSGVEAGWFAVAPTQASPRSLPPSPPLTASVPPTEPAFRPALAPARPLSSFGQQRVTGHLWLVLGLTHSQLYLR